MSDDNDPQAPPAMMDRIAAHFGLAAAKEAPEPAAPQTQAEEPSGDELADLTWGEKTYRVPSTLKDAFMRNEDYTRDFGVLTESLRDLRRCLKLLNAINDNMTAAVQSGKLAEFRLAEEKRRAASPFRKIFRDKPNE